ncbi:hypothetical protein THF1A12_40342 [Vibrio jasicida]|uniref:Transposase n=1 Tax=Vibrio jasicida TaxID=766224 RepID=A0AAU9QTY4_9VIBR|nr:hypothetical protein THF1A12_40342 [Vibrio jasicida]
MTDIGRILITSLGYDTLNPVALAKLNHPENTKWRPTHKDIKS